MSPTKVTLSTKERQLVTNTEWILTKNQVIQKAYELFGVLSASYQREILAFPSYHLDEVLKRSPKIAKGEQYQGLPWVMLDFPRCYEGSDMFGIRSFFWWGNVFSISLLLSGKFLHNYAPALEKNLADAALAKDWLLGVGNDPWEHHFGEDNYQPLHLMDRHLIKGGSFIKLTKRFAASDWSDKQEQFENGFETIGKLLR